MSSADSSVGCHEAAELTIVVGRESPLIDQPGVPPPVGTVSLSGNLYVAAQCIAGDMLRIGGQS